MPRGKSLSEVDQARVMARLEELLKKLSGSQIAKMIGVSQSNISEVVRGKYRPGKSLAEKLLGVEVDEIQVVQKRQRREPLPPERRRGRVRHRERLRPRDEAGSGLRDEHLDEREGDVYTLPGRGRSQHDLLAQERSEDPEVTPLAKSKRLELDEQNNARRLAGHNQLKIKVYSCLDCRSRFESVGDRMCSKCKGGTLATISGTDIYI